MVEQCLALFTDEEASIAYNESTINSRKKLSQEKLTFHQESIS